MATVLIVDGEETEVVGGTQNYMEGPEGTEDEMEEEQVEGDGLLMSAGSFHTQTAIDDTQGDIDPEEVLKTYYETYTKEEKTWYSCKHCANWKTDHNSTMRDHVNAKHMRMMLKCTHCVFETLRFKTLNFHRRKFHNLSAMSCPVEGCSYKTILQERLRDHLIRKHGMARESAKATVADILQSQGGVMEDGQILCNLDDELQYGSAKPRRMKSTRTSWPSGWKHKDRFPRKTDEERQYRLVLDEAGNRTGVQCLYCEFTTRLPSNMPGHVNAKHLGKSVKCPECSFTTFYPKNLACHVKKLHGRSTRQCFMERCKFRFFQDDKMHVHLMEKHNCVYDEVRNAIIVDM